ncbi:MAG TPA: aminotransferase class I/II-fold pyridoxal phosphate-dependent enzyme [Thermoleophilia bacterium]|nr:aminotransferase class I/II-fold pyridoxal phosphate-dependent enzyme [Thermoleophilia bacterium]
MMGGVVFADRVARLGTETVFAVAEEAQALAAQGRKVYPFHMGELNIPTPEHIVSATVRALRDGKTKYTPNGGLPELREALAEDVGRDRGVDYGGENVAIQPAGKPVIGKFLLTLMDPGDEVLYPNPGFPIYSSLIGFFGGVPVPYAYAEGGGRFGLDLESIERGLTPRTRLLILNDNHNPTTAECTLEELERLAQLIREHDLYVLCDEAYFDIRFGGASRSLVSLPGMKDRCVILYTFGKKYAMTGFRLGAAIGPRPIIDVIVTLNVNWEACPNHFAQYGALEALTGDQSALPRMIATFRERRDAGLRILNGSPGVHCLTPTTTFYLYPNVTEAVKSTGCADHESFRRLVLQNTGVSFSTRPHFGRPLEGETARYLRISYSGIDTEEIEEGLGKLKAFLESQG